MATPFGASASFFDEKWISGILSFQSPTGSYSMYETELNLLLSRSSDMYAFMASHVEQLHQAGPVRGLKFHAAFQSGLLSFEHGYSLLKLVEQGAVSSGFALMRPQFECLIRGFLLLYADTEVWLEKIAALGTVGLDEMKKYEPPMLADMFKALECSAVPPDILAQLKSFREVNNIALNSFTHGGLMALVGNGAGYKPQSLYNALRNCNAVAAINMQMLSILTGVKDAMTPVRTIHQQFTDCLPIIHS